MINPLADHLSAALVALVKARSLLLKGEPVPHREAVLHEITQGELSLIRVLGLIGGAPEG